VSTSSAGVNFQCWRQLPVLVSTSSVGVNFQLTP
jgi:hypothetical protein